MTNQTAGQISPLDRIPSSGVIWGPSKTSLFSKSPWLSVLHQLPSPKGAPGKGWDGCHMFYFLLDD